MQMSLNKRSEISASSPTKKKPNVRLLSPPKITTLPANSVPSWDRLNGAEESLFFNEIKILCPRGVCIDASGISWHLSHQRQMRLTSFCSSLGLFFLRLPDSQPYRLHMYHCRLMNFCRKRQFFEHQYARGDPCSRYILCCSLEYVTSWFTVPRPN